MTDKTTEKYRFIDEGRKHMHTIDGKPLLGTSSVVDIIAKTLHWWSAELAAVECLEVGEKIPTIREEYLAVAKLPQIEKKKGIDALCVKYPIFRKARYAHHEKKNEVADTGTDMHAELEKYVKKCIEQNGGNPLALPKDPKEHLAVIQFADWSFDNIEKFLFSEGYCYAKEAWVGGICDCGALMKNSKIAIFDFKSAKEAYYGHFIQVAGYALEIEENGVLDKNGNLVLKLDKPIEELYVVPFGAEDTTPRVRYDVEDKKIDFLAAVRLYKGEQNN